MATNERADMNNETSNERIRRAAERGSKAALRAMSALKFLFPDEAERTRADLRQRDDKTLLIDRPGIGDISTTVVIGNGADGGEYAEKLGPYFDEFGPSHFIVYPKRKFSVDAVGDKIIEAGAMDKGMRRAIICFSMGQMVINHLFTQPGFVDNVGTVDYLISDSGVANVSNLQSKTWMLLNIGGRVQPSHTVAKVYDRIMGSTDKRLYEELSQWYWMLHAPVLEPGSLSHIGDKIPVKHYTSAHEDYRVKLNESHSDLNEIWGGGWEWTRSLRRSYCSHTQGLDCPEDFTDILRIPVER